MNLQPLAVGSLGDYSLFFRQGGLGSAKGGLRRKILGKSTSSLRSSVSFPPVFLLTLLLLPSCASLPKGMGKREGNNGYMPLSSLYWASKGHCSSSGSNQSWKPSNGSSWLFKPRKVLSLGLGREKKKTPRCFS